MIADALKVLYVGPDYPGSNGTCWRDAFTELGHQVLTVDSERLLFHPETVISKIKRKITNGPPTHVITNLNETIRTNARTFRPDLTFYVKGDYVLPETAMETGRHGLNFAYM